MVTWLIGSASLAIAEPLESGVRETKLDPTALEDQAARVLQNRCVSCHGPDKTEGELRLDTLDTMDATNRQT
ncbi:MAG: hypothetical protein NXI22_25995, partial [bacterium]|nr:hypothetical protein [bacterium]